MVTTMLEWPFRLCEGCCLPSRLPQLYKSGRDKVGKIAVDRGQLPDIPGTEVIPRTADSSHAVGPENLPSNTAPSNVDSTGQMKLDPLRKYVEDTLASRQIQPIDVGFMTVELLPIQDGPWHEVYLKAKDHSWTEIGVLSLYDFLSYVVSLPLTTNGFVITYDMRDIATPQIDVLSDLVAWTADDAQKEIWSSRCKHWKVLVEDGLHYHYVRLLMGTVFYMFPPEWKTYIVTDPSATLGDDVVCYSPETALGHGTEECNDLHRDLAACVTQTTDLTTSPSPCSPCVATGGTPPNRQDVGFAVLVQGYCNDTRLGYFQIIATDGELTDDGVTAMLSFMDAFVSSSNAAGGFCITYDLRALRMPSLSMLKRVADWGAEPERELVWKKLNQACKIVVSPGIRYTLAKGVLTTFFAMCPPIVRTFLMTELDEPEDNATLFKPPANADACTTQAGHFDRVSAYGSDVQNNLPDRDLVIEPPLVDERPSKQEETKQEANNGSMSMLMSLGFF